MKLFTTLWQLSTVTFACLINLSLFHQNLKEQLNNNNKGLKKNVYLKWNLRSYDSIISLKQKCISGMPLNAASDKCILFRKPSYLPVWTAEDSSNLPGSFSPATNITLESPHPALVREWNLVIPNGNSICVSRKSNFEGFHFFYWGWLGRRGAGVGNPAWNCFCYVFFWFENMFDICKQALAMICYILT